MVFYKYNQLLDVWPSGSSDADIYEKAQKVFKNEHLKHGFKLRGCWLQLKRCPKFEKCDKDIRPSKKMKTNEFGGYSFSNVGTSENEDVSAQRTCPIGQKEAKKKVRGKVKEKTSPETVEEWNKRMYEVEDTTMNKVTKNTEALERIAQKGKWKVLMANTTNMTPEQLQLHNLYCDKIRKKWTTE